MVPMPPLQRRAVLKTLQLAVRHGTTAPRRGPARESAFDHRAAVVPQEWALSCAPSTKSPPARVECRRACILCLLPSDLPPSRGTAPQGQPLQGAEGRNGDPHLSAPPSRWRPTPSPPACPSIVRVETLMAQPRLQRAAHGLQQGHVTPSRKDERQVLQASRLGTLWPKAAEAGVLTNPCSRASSWPSPRHGGRPARLLPAATHELGRAPARPGHALPAGFIPGRISMKNAAKAYQLLVAVVHHQHCRPEPSGIVPSSCNEA